MYYDQSDAGASQSGTAAAPSGHSDTAASPAERSDAVSDTALSDAARRRLPPVGHQDDEASRFADDLTASLAGEPAAPPTAPSPPDAKAADESSLPLDEPPPAGPSTTVDDLFGPPATSAESAPPPPGAADQPASPPARADAPRPNTRRMAWLMGSKWSLAALAHDRGAPDEEVQKWFGQSRTLAGALGLTLPDLPERAAAGDGRPAGGTALDYLFEQGQQVGRDLAGRCGPDHAALFEVAVKSNILLVLYEPGASVVDAIGSAIGEGGGRAGLPAELYEPLLAALARRAPLADVSQAVFHLHDEVDRYLAAPEAVAIPAGG